jgi:hypothetical protein
MTRENALLPAFIPQDPVATASHFQIVSGLGDFLQATHESLALPWTPSGGRALPAGPAGIRLLRIGPHGPSGGARPVLACARGAPGTGPLEPDSRAVSDRRPGRPPGGSSRPGLGH